MVIQMTVIGVGRGGYTAVDFTKLVLFIEWLLAAVNIMSLSSTFGVNATHCDN